MKPKAVFFDLDGTLADTAADLVAAAEGALKRRGRMPEQPVLLSDAKPLVSRGVRGLLSLYGLEQTDADFEKIRDDFLEIYEQHNYQQTVLFENIELMLEKLKIDYKIAVVTNKPRYLAEGVMQRLGLADDENIGLYAAGDCKRSKPYPDLLQKAASDAQIACERCLYVGDALNDAKAAENAGMPFVLCVWGGYFNPTQWEDTHTHVDYIISEPMQLFACIDSL